jgi:hypothetical protein
MTDGPTEVSRDDVEPEATPEQEAYVTALLSSLRADDPPMPEYVVARLDAVLAQERLTSAAAPGRPAAALESAPDQVPLASVTVLPTASELPSQRRSPLARGVRILGGLAAAVVLVVGGNAVITGNLGGSSSSTSAGGAPAGVGDASTSMVALQDSGTAYTKASLSSQATALAARAQASPQLVTGSVSSAASGSGLPAVPSPGTAEERKALTQAGLPSCVEQLSGRPGVVPLAADTGTYDGRPALVVILPTDRDPTSLDVWVIGPVCTATTADLYEFRRIPVPAR